MEPIDADKAAQFLAKYGDSLSQCGFLSPHLPLRVLPDPRYSTWESIAANLPTLIRTGRIRNAIDACPLESAQGLRDEGEWRRAFVLLTYMSHSYIWGGAPPAEVLPPQLSVPLLHVSAHFGLPPILTLAAATLWNFTSSDPSSGLSPSSLAPLISFTGTSTESWFLMVSVAAESIGGAIIHAILSAVRAAICRNSPAVTAALRQLASHFGKITTILARLPEQCDPMPFYHDVRPFYAGTKNMESAGLPRGVLYDTGDGKGKWKKFRGGNNGQSSLFPLIDLALGIQRSSRTTAKSRECGHNDGAESDYHTDVLMYMPSEHRNFLADFAQIWNIHDVINAVEDPTTSEALQAAYVQATTALVQFRSKHIQIVSRYIIVPSKKSVPVGHVTGAQPLLVRTSQTQLMPFLKKVRQQTLTASETYSRKE